MKRKIMTALAAVALVAVPATTAQAHHTMFVTTYNACLYVYGGKVWTVHHYDPFTGQPMFNCLRKHR